MGSPVATNRFVAMGHGLTRCQGRAQDVGSGYSKFLKSQKNLAPGIPLRTYARPPYTVCWPCTPARPPALPAGLCPPTNTLPWTTCVPCVSLSATAPPSLAGIGVPARRPPHSASHSRTRSMASSAGMPGRRWTCGSRTPRTTLMTCCSAARSRPLPTPHGGGGAGGRGGGRVVRGVYDAGHRCFGENYV